MTGPQLFIGGVTALTGISAGRIRHYGKLGLLSPDRLDSGYRTFGPPDVLTLLRIDLLRSLGMGITEIRDCLTGDPAGVREALEQHRAVLDRERDRIDRLLGAVDLALAHPDEDPNAAMTRLATTHRDSLGLIGRLSEPLSPGSGRFFHDTFRDWDLPIPPLFGQMILPEPITRFLDHLAATPGHEDFFARLLDLARRVVALSPTDPTAPENLARGWVDEQLAATVDPALAAALAETVPTLLDLPVIRHGFLAWADSLSPAAGRFMAAVETEADHRGADVLGVIVVPRPTA